MARLCQICEQLESKYKCPICRAPYCSATCYKAHKETPCALADATSGNSSSGAGVNSETALPTPNGAKLQASDEGDEDIDPTKLLTMEQLVRLRQSARAQEQLGNPHIRALLVQIDASNNRMKALEKALLDPVFSNFMFRTLDEIESSA